jgi:hypothetical protein
VHTQYMLDQLGFDTQNYCNYIWEDGKAYDIGTANMILFTIILGIKPMDKQIIKQPAADLIN